MLTVLPVSLILTFFFNAIQSYTKLQQSQSKTNSNQVTAIRAMALLAVWRSSPNRSNPILGAIFPLRKDRKYPPDRGGGATQRVHTHANDDVLRGKTSTTVVFLDGRNLLWRKNDWHLSVRASLALYFSTFGLSDMDENYGCAFFVTYFNEQFSDSFFCGAGMILKIKELVD